MVTGTVVCSTCFEERQQCQRLCCAPPYEYGCKQPWGLLSGPAQHSPRDWCPSWKHVDQSVPVIVTKVYQNATYSPEDCNLIHMVVHNTVPGTAALLRTMLTKQSRRPLKRSLVVLLSSFDSKWPNNRSPDCHHIHIVEQHTVSGKAAVLRSMLTEQKSQGPLLGFTRMLHTVCYISIKVFITVFIIVRVWSVMCNHETLTLFILWCTTQSQGLMPFLETCWPNSPGDHYQSLRERYTQSRRL